MILILYSHNSKRSARLAEILIRLKTEEIEIKAKLISTPLPGLEIEITKDIISLAKKATKILLHFQPTIFDIQDPYFDYFPYIYSFLYCHSSIKNKFYFIHPFYLPSATEFRQAVFDKLRLGDFKEIPSDGAYYLKPLSLPVSDEQIANLHQTIYDFCTQ
jgi:hypothetical protein